MSYAVDTFQNTPPDRRWTGVVTKHPDEGGPGTEVHRRIGYPSEAAAAEGCDAAIAKHARSVPVPAQELVSRSIE